MPASRLAQAEVSRRREQVMKARAAGMSFAQIAASVPGVANAAAAAQDHRRALEQAAKLRLDAGEDSAGALEVELQRLESATLAVEGVLRNAAADPSLHDRVLRATDRIARLTELRVNILGLGLTQKPGQAAAPVTDDLAALRARVGQRRRSLG